MLIDRPIPLAWRKGYCQLCGARVGVLGHLTLDTEPVTILTEKFDSKGAITHAYPVAGYRTHEC